MSSDAALAEEQTVLSECSCLITEQMAHLSKLLIERGGAGLSGFATLLPVHLNVPASQEAVHNVDQLKPRQGKGSNQVNKLNTLNKQFVKKKSLFILSISLDDGLLLECSTAATRLM